MISARTRRLVMKILPYPAIFYIGGLLYAILEAGMLGSTRIYPATKNIYEPLYSFMTLPLMAATIGLMTGVFEEILFKRFLSKKAFVVRVIFKSIIHILILISVVILSMFPFNAYLLGVGLGHERVVTSVLLFVQNFAFWSIIIYTGSIIFLTMFITSTFDRLGSQSVQHLFTGKYLQSKQESRIFMFLDMQSSTSHAESLGHERYYQLLRRYYEYMTEAILESRGEIYQYVGDEIVISWPFGSGLAKSACLKCFFDIEKSIQERADMFLKDFGIVPAFKAGIHAGTVTAGEIGRLKKDILFTGDVLNTTARIQAECNGLEAKLLISSELFDLLNDKRDYEFRRKGEFLLRGKEKKIGMLEVLSLE